MYSLLDILVRRDCAICNKICNRVQILNHKNIYHQFEKLIVFFQIIILMVCITIMLANDYYMYDDGHHHTETFCERLPKHLFRVGLVWSWCVLGLGVWVGIRDSIGATLGIYLTILCLTSVIMAYNSQSRSVHDKFAIAIWIMLFPIGLYGIILSICDLINGGLDISRRFVVVHVLVFCSLYVIASIRKLYQVLSSTRSNSPLDNGFV